MKQTAKEIASIILETRPILSKSFSAVFTEINDHQEADGQKEQRLSNLLIIIKTIKLLNIESFSRLVDGNIISIIYEILSNTMDGSLDINNQEKLQSAILKELENHNNTLDNICLFKTEIHNEEASDADADKNKPHKQDDNNNNGDDSADDKNAGHEEGLSNVGKLFLGAAAILVPAIGYAVLSDKKEVIKETASYYIEQIKNISLDDAITYVADTAVKAHKALSSAVESLDTSFAEKAISDLNPYMVKASEYIDGAMNASYAYVEEYEVVNSLYGALDSAVDYFCQISGACSQENNTDKIEA